MTAACPTSVRAASVAPCNVTPRSRPPKTIGASTPSSTTRRSPARGSVGLPLGTASDVAAHSPRPLASIQSGAAVDGQTIGARSAMPAATIAVVSADSTKPAASARRPPTARTSTLSPTSAPSTASATGIAGSRSESTPGDSRLMPRGPHRHADEQQRGDGHRRCRPPRQAPAERGSPRRACRRNRHIVELGVERVVSTELKGRHRESVVTRCVAPRATPTRTWVSNRSRGERRAHLDWSRRREVADGGDHVSGREPGTGRRRIGVDAEDGGAGARQSLQVQSERRAVRDRTSECGRQHLYVPQPAASADTERQRLASFEARESDAPVLEGRHGLPTDGLDHIAHRYDSSCGPRRVHPRDDHASTRAGCRRDVRGQRLHVDADVTRRAAHAADEAFAFGEDERCGHDRPPRRRARRPCRRTRQRS